MIINAIRDFIRQCPHMPDFARMVNVNYLEREANSYMIEETPCDPIVKRYVNGDCVKRYNFTLASREIYSDDVMQNLNNSGFYEKFSDWIENCNFNRQLPVLEDGKEAIKIKVTTSGYIFDTEMDKCQYQIQMSLEYFHKKL